MSTDAIERMRQRVRRVRAAVLVRRWEFRQRHHARGVWLRLRRLLADSEAAWRISAEDAERLIAEGFQPDPVGLELEPPITILVLPATRVVAVESRQPVALRLGAELLTTRHLVLTPWP